MIAAKPTTYKSARFRSRLEAKWAAFFDLCGWKWEYEPVDYAGWVPDFLLIGERGTIPVEVKPIEWAAEEDKCVNELKNRQDLKKVREYVEPRNYNDEEHLGREALVLGCYPINFYISDKCYNRCVFLGGIISNEWTQFDIANFYAKRNSWPVKGRGKHTCDYAAVDGCYSGRIFNHKDHLYRVFESQTKYSDEFIVSSWREAGRLTQWMAPA